MKRQLLILALICLASPAFAKGQHIACHTEGSLTAEDTKTVVVHDLRFYLDDTGEQIIPESAGIAVKARLYSDTDVRASITDDGFASLATPMLYGRVLDGPADFLLNRVNGSLVIAAKFLGRSASIESGTCHAVVPPPTRF